MEEIAGNISRRYRISSIPFSSLNLSRIRRFRLRNRPVRFTCASPTQVFDPRELHSCTPSVFRVGIRDRHILGRWGEESGRVHECRECAGGARGSAIRSVSRLGIIITVPVWHRCVAISARGRYWSLQVVASSPEAFAISSVVVRVVRRHLSSSVRNVSRSTRESRYTEAESNGKNEVGLRDLRVTGPDDRHAGQR